MLFPPPPPPGVVVEVGVVLEVEVDFFGHSKHLSISKSSGSKDPPVHVYPSPMDDIIQKTPDITMTRTSPESPLLIIIIPRDLNPTLDG
jgi:hypothetical protein